MSDEPGRAGQACAAADCDIVFVDLVGAAEDCENKSFVVCRIHDGEESFDLDILGDVG